MLKVKALLTQSLHTYCFWARKIKDRKVWSPGLQGVRQVLPAFQDVNEKEGPIICSGGCRHSSQQQLAQITTFLPIQT